MQPFSSSLTAAQQCIVYVSQPQVWSYWTASLILKHKSLCALPGRDQDGTASIALDKSSSLIPGNDVAIRERNPLINCQAKMAPLAGEKALGEFPGWRFFL